jgi:glutamine cyclotransferase
MINIEIQQQLENKVVALAFFDAGFVQQYRDKRQYIPNKGSTNANNSYSLRGAGLGLKRTDQDLVLSATIAWKLGHNPLYDTNGLGVNNDGRSNSAYLWAQAQWIF